MGAVSYLVVVLVTLLSAASVSALPRQQEEEALPGVRWSEAKVEVSLTPGDAHSDLHSHANIRVNGASSTLKITMENRLYQLNLTPTTWLVSPGATLSRVGVPGGVGQYQALPPRPCLYQAHPQHPDDHGTAGSVSLCHSDGPHLMLMMDDDLAQLIPMPSLPPNVSKRDPNTTTTSSFTHVVKRHPLPAILDQDCQDHETCSRAPTVPSPVREPDMSQIMIDPTSEDVKRVAQPPTSLSKTLTVELGIILDQALLDTFRKYLSTEQELTDLVLGLVNNVQALYRHPSLGRQVDLTITHLRLLDKQPEDLPDYHGDRVLLLKSFCSYNHRNNQPDDDHPDHWDIGIYLSGLNLFMRTPDGSIDGETMGLAYTGGVCKPALSCLISELGSVNYRGRPYPSSGALSSYVLAHEIGHSLGLRHDGVSNECARSGFIMAAGRGLKGATTWSSCAKEKIQKQMGACLSVGADNGTSSWNHSVYRGLPGQRWDATAQCQLFLRDTHAVLANISRIDEVCHTVTCVSPKRISTYLAGPALEGTHCGGQNWCQGGQCVPWGDRGPSEVVVGGWGPWTHDPCDSGCVQGATGYQVSRRLCDSPAAKNSVEGCVGSQTKVSLCPDEEVCGSTPRKTVNELASELCKVVSTLKKDIDGVGRQLSYSADVAWQACAVYCQKKNTTSFWTPRYEFKDAPNVPTHLPDGTPCNEGQYVCVNRQCVPKMPQMRHGGPLRTPSPAYETTDPEPGELPPIDLDNLFS